MKRVLTFILVLSMILGSIGMVFAAPALDDIAGTVYEKAVNRLALLEILEGYPDGTFKPDNTITRAEFAAVAVRAKGLRDAAEASEGLATGFTDVPASHWASGYINIATKLGLVNGMGDGTYAPEAPITYEQAVTLIVRTLGYEPSAQTKGGYPYGYLIVANEIELLDDVKGVQGAPASRGIVAQIADNALEIPKMIQVGFGTDAKFVVSGSKEHGDDAEKQLLLNDLGVDEYYGFVTNSRIEKTLKANEIRIDGKKFEITDNVDSDAVLGAGVTAWAKDDLVFSMSLGYKYKVNGVKYEFTADQVIYDELTKSNKNEVSLTVLDDEYDWVTKPEIYVNNKKAAVEDVNGAWGRLVLNKYDEIDFAYLFKFDAGNSGIVTGFDKDDIEYINLYADEDVLAIDKAKNVYVFNEDLSRADLDDIEEETAIFYWVDKEKSKDDFYIVITDEIEEGNLDSVRVSDSRVTVDGTNVLKADDAIFSDDEMKDFREWEDYLNLKDCVDEDVIVYKNLAGKAIALVTDAKAKSSKIYGIATWKTDARKPVLSVYTVEGKEVDYKFAETKDAAKASAQKAADGYEVVAFKLNKDGEIAKDEFEVIGKSITFSKVDKDKFATDGGKKYYLTKDTVILKALNSKGEIKPSVIEYDDIIKKTVDENNDAIIATVKDKGDDLAVVVFINKAFDAVDTTKYALVLESPRKVGKDYKVEIDIAGEGKGDYVLEDVKIEDVKKGSLIAFKFNHKDEVSVKSIEYSVKEKGVSVVKKEGNYLKIGDTTYRTSGDTVYYETDKKGKLDGTTRLSKIGAGDKVVILANGKDELQVVVVVSAYAGVDGGGGKEADGEVGGIFTFRGDTWITIEGVDYILPAQYDAKDYKKGDKVNFESREIDGDKVITYIEILGEEPEPPEVDKTELEEAIAAAEALDEDDYTEESWAVLEAALALPESTQAQVDAKVEAIREAIAGLVEKGEEPPVGITAEAILVNKLLGVESYAISVEGAELTDVEKVLVNNDEKTFEITEGVIRVNSGSAVTSIKIVVDGKTIDVTIK